MVTWAPNEDGSNIAAVTTMHQAIAIASNSNLDEYTIPVIGKYRNVGEAKRISDIHNGHIRIVELYEHKLHRFCGESADLNQGLCHMNSAWMTIKAVTDRGTFVDVVDDARNVCVAAPPPPRVLRATDDGVVR